MTLEPWTEVHCHRCGCSFLATRDGHRVVPDNAELICDRCEAFDAGAQSVALDVAPALHALAQIRQLVGGEPADLVWSVDDVVARVAELVGIVAAQYADATPGGAGGEVAAGGSDDGASPAACDGCGRSDDFFLQQVRRRGTADARRGWAVLTCGCGIVADVRPAEPVVLAVDGPVVDFTEPLARFLAEPADPGTCNRCNGGLWRSFGMRAADDQIGCALCGWTVALATPLERRPDVAGVRS